MFCHYFAMHHFTVFYYLVSVCVLCLFLVIPWAVLWSGVVAHPNYTHLAFAYHLL